jgi:flavodoxin
MEEKIETRLKAYHSRENIELFFDITNMLVTQLEIDKDNPRLCLNTRNEKDRQRISLNLNSWLVGGLRSYEDKDVFLIMLYKTDANNLLNKGVNLISKDKEFKDAIGLEKAQTFSIDDAEFISHKDEIIPLWLKCCADYYPKNTASQYRKHHLPELYELVVDRNFREIQLNWILDGNIDSFIDSFIKEPYYQNIINEKEFYLEKLKLHFKEFKTLSVTKYQNEIEALINNIPKPFSYKEILDNESNGQLKDYLLLIGILVTYFDTNGYNKQEWNKYQDKRVISKSNLRQDKWLINFSKYKLNNCSVVGIENELNTAFIRSIEYLEDAINNAPITSNNHRNQIVKSFKLNNENDIIKLFGNYTMQVANVENKSTLVTLILYHPTIKKLWCKNDSLSEELESIENTNNEIKHSTKMTHPLNQIFYGSPGTGKTYHTINYALSIIEDKTIEELENENREDIKKRYDKLVDEGRIVFTTFHQSMSYEDFIEGIKPETINGLVTYEVSNGIFKEIANKADSRKGNFYEVLENFKQEVFEDDSKKSIEIGTINSPFEIKYTGGTFFLISPRNTIKTEKPWYYVTLENVEKYFNTNSLSGISNSTYVKGIVEYLLQKKGLQKGTSEQTEPLPYVLIIDEINRGNVSAIFGELITLIEDSKRIGKDEALKVKLPYSKKEFGVPNNLYIIGTMNTADRSVEALDTALRRRFSFVEMPPNYNLEMLQNEIINNISLKSILVAINQRIEYLLNRDHSIGHSYFLHVNSIEDLQITFFKNIIPLLQEYFYGDYAKMSLVIGEGFFESQKDKPKVKFAKGLGDAEVPEKTIVTLKSKWEAGEFEKAIQILLGNETK